MERTALRVSVLSLEGIKQRLGSGQRDTVEVIQMQMDRWILWRPESLPPWESILGQEDPAERLPCSLSSHYGPSAVWRILQTLEPQASQQGREWGAPAPLFYRWGTSSGDQVPQCHPHHPPKLQVPKSARPASHSSPLPREDTSPVCLVFFVLIKYILS